MSSIFVSALLGSSPAIQSFNQQLDDAILKDVLVVLLGEAETGKASAAFKIHQQTSFADAPFITLDCSTLEPELFESSLFGHLSGAFSGAITNQQGRIELATGGTLFLDEVQFLSQAVMIKLFNAIAQGFYYPLGSEQPSILNARIVLGVNTSDFCHQAWLDIAQIMPAQLDVNALTLPALRERPADIADLFSAYYLFCFDQSLISPDLSSDALAQLQQFGWFNNLLDMKSLVELLGNGWHGREVTLQALPLSFQAAQMDAMPALFDSAEPDDSPQAELDFAALSDCWGFNDSWAPTTSDVIEVDNFNLDENKGLKTYLQDIEIALILAALKRCDENVSRAAKLLKLNRTTLVEKIKKYAISA